MITVPLLQREHCSYCLKDVRLGQSITECNDCDKIIHTRCFKSSQFQIINNLNYCSACKCAIIVRYNPFKLIEVPENGEDENYEFDFDEIATASDILEKCNPFSLDDFNHLPPTLFNDNMSSFFLNIDGNASNFDNFLVEYKNHKHSFSVIGLAETNTGEGDVYQIPGYYNFYQDTLEGKSTGIN